MSPSTINDVSASLKAVDSSLKNIRSAHDLCGSKIDDVSTALALTKEKIANPLMNYGMKKLKAENARLIHKLERAEFDAQVADAGRNSNHVSLDVLKVAYAKVTTELKAKDGELLALNNEIDFANEQYDEKLAECAVTVKERDAAIAARDAAVVARDTAAELLETAKIEAVSVSEQLDAKQAEIVAIAKGHAAAADQAKAECALIAKERDATIVERDAAAKLLEAAKIEVASANEQLEMKQAELVMAKDHTTVADQVKAECALIAKERDAAVVARDAITELLVTTKIEAAFANEQHDEKQARIAAMVKERVTVAYQLRAECAAIATERDAAIVEREAVAERVKAECTAIAKERDAAVAEHATVVEKLKAEIARAADDLKKKDQEIAIANAFRECAEASSSAAEHRIASLELKLEKEYQRSRDDFATISHLQVDISDLCMNLAKTKNQHAISLQNFNNVCAELAAAHFNLRMAQNEIDAYSGELDGARVECEQYKQAAAAAQEQTEHAYAACNQAQMMTAAAVGRSTALERELESQKRTCGSVRADLSETQRALITSRSENAIMAHDLEEEKEKNAAAARLLQCDGKANPLACTCHYHLSRALRVARAGEAAALQMVDDLNIKHLTTESALNDMRCAVERSLSSGSETLVSHPVPAGEGEGEEEEEDNASETNSDASSEVSVVILGCDPGLSSSSVPSSSTPEASGRPAGGGGGGFVARSLGAHMPGHFRR